MQTAEPFWDLGYCLIDGVLDVQGGSEHGVDASLGPFLVWERGREMQNQVLRRHRAVVLPFIGSECREGVVPCEHDVVAVR